MHDLRLSSPPSIETRILAALQDPFPFQVIYYNRNEGATYAVEALVKEHEDLMMVVKPILYRDTLRRGVRCIASSSRLPDGIAAKVFIADVITDVEIQQWHRMVVQERGHRLIVLKSIVNYDGHPGVNGLDLKTGEPISNFMYLGR